MLGQAPAVHTVPRRQAHGTCPVSFPYSTFPGSIFHVYWETLQVSLQLKNKPEASTVVQQLKMLPLRK